MEADKIDDDWNVRKEILNASNRNQLCLKLAICLFVMMDFVTTITVAVFHGIPKLYGFPFVIFPLICFIFCFYLICRDDDLEKTTLLIFLCKLRREFPKIMSDKATFQCEVYLKEMESILKDFNRRGFLDQDMLWYQVDKYFFKIQSTIIQSGDEFESIMTPRAIKGWKIETRKYQNLMEFKWVFRDMATFIHEYFCRKTGIGVN